MSDDGKKSKQNPKKQVDSDVEEEVDIDLGQPNMFNENQNIFNDNKHQYQKRDSNRG